MRVHVLGRALGPLGCAPLAGLERLFRDGRAAWVMSPSTELTRQWVAKLALFGEEALDYWSQHANQRLLQYELRKLSPAQRQALGLVQGKANDAQGAAASASAAAAAAGT